MKYALKNGIVLDGTLNMEPQNDVIVLVNEDKIEAIVPGSYDTKGYTDIDLAHQYLMPGLINLHAHLTSDGRPSKKEGRLSKLTSSFSFRQKAIVKNCSECARTELLSGVTTLRTAGGLEGMDTLIRAQFEEEENGPRIITANKAIGVAGANMDERYVYEAHDEEEVRKLIYKLAGQNVDYIKIVITGGVNDRDIAGEPGELKMPASFVRTAVIIAHELGLKVAARCESPSGLSLALDNGVDLIEHGSLVNKNMIDLYKHNPSVNICTISPLIPYLYFDEEVIGADPETKRAGETIMRGIVEGARTCLANHIPVGLGSGASSPYVTHYDMWRELVYFTYFCHVDNNFALHTATCVNAHILGKEFTIGTIEAGKTADMIVTKENPLEDLRALANLSLVMYKGNLIESPQPQHLEEADAELDRVMDLIFG